MPTLPYTFQLADVRRVHQTKGRCLISWDAGLGKTLLALLYIHRHPEVLPAVVVCPAPLKLQWSRESAHHFGMRAEVVSGVNPEKIPTAHRPPITIVNYDILAPHKYGPGWVKALRAMNPKIIILDESQFCADQKTQRVRAVKELCRGVPHILALSATPIMNKPAEMFPVLNILRPDLFPSWWSYAHRYCSPQRTFFGWSFEGASHLDELHKILVEGKDGSGPVMIRRRKADVIHQLPDKIRTIVPLEMSDPEQYEEAEENFLSWLSDKEPNKLYGAARAEGLVKAGYLKRLAAELKLTAALAWIDNWLLGEGKILLFCVHKKIVAELHKKYQGRCVVVDGSVTGKKRQSAVDQFQKNPRTRVFIGNIKAAGVGLNLTAGTATAFLEYGWKPSDHYQAEERSYARLSDIHGTQVFYLTANDTIEVRIAQRIQRKQQHVSAVLDGTGDTDELNLFDMICDELRQAKHREAQRVD